MTARGANGAVATTRRSRPEAEAVAAKTSNEPYSVRVTHLEMLSPPAAGAPMPSRPRLALKRAPRIPLAFYRRLYEQVGKPHHWMARREMDDAELSAIVHHEDTEIRVLYGDGAPAGFMELDLSRKPQEIEIVYFGLSPDFQGLGIGKFFLSRALDAAWAHAPSKVTLHTNTLDSPRALRIYRKAGFAPCGYSEETITDWL